jgi:thiol:disulfide interchange protein
MLRTGVICVRTAMVLLGGLLAALGCGIAPVTPAAGGAGAPTASSLAPAASPPASPAAAVVPFETAPAPPASAGANESVAPVEYSTPLLDEPALARAIRSSCDAALASKRPVLLEFSAPWCEDCRVLERLKRRPALAVELARWQLLPINIGDGDAHPGLMRAFQVRAIAKLVVVAPSNCAAPIGTWPRGATRTLDGLSKHAEHAEEELASWLASVRAAPARH